MQQQVSQSVVEVGCFQNGADFFLEAEAVVEAVRRHVVMLLYDTFANVISAASIPCQESLGDPLSSYLLLATQSNSTEKRELMISFICT